MRTKEDVVHAFTAVGKLTEAQKMCILRLETAFKDLATDIVEYTPESADRTAALRKLLEVKFTCIQAITHVISTDLGSTKKGNLDEKKETKTPAKSA